MATKPKNMTPEQEAVWVGKEKARRAAWWTANRERLMVEKRGPLLEIKGRKHPLSLATIAGLARKKRMGKDKQAEWKRIFSLVKEKADTRKNIEDLSDSYVAQVLGLPVSSCSQDLIQNKREQLEIVRLNRQLNQLLKDKNHDH